MQRSNTHDDINARWINIVPLIFSRFYFSLRIPTFPFRRDTTTERIATFISRFSGDNLFECSADFVDFRSVHTSINLLCVHQRCAGIVFTLHLCRLHSANKNVSLCSVRNFVDTCQHATHIWPLLYPSFPVYSFIYIFLLHFQHEFAYSQSLVFAFVHCLPMTEIREKQEAKGKSSIYSICIFIFSYFLVSVVIPGAFIPS